MDFQLASSGIHGLDQILNGLRLGDNVVWQVDKVEDYSHFARPLAKEALSNGKRVVYLRFGQHPPVLSLEGLQTYYLNASRGFEHFSAEIRKIVTKEGQGVYYIFDSLSELLSEWSTDLMIGNFFMVTCPYLFELNTIAYFALLRNSHSYQTIARIRDTTQLLLDIYHKDDYYVHPLKVWRRYSPTMFFPHLERDGKYLPLTSSADVTRFFSEMPQNIFGNAERKIDYWDHIFIKAAELLNTPADGNPDLNHDIKALKEQIIQMLIGRDNKFLNLARKYLSLEDLLQIKSRLIGSGFIGGKAVGLILSRAILHTHPTDNWDQILEPHDSFFVGSDVFYTYLVENGCWQLRQAQKEKENYFSAAAQLKEKITTGKLPEAIQSQFLEMLEYFGQAPIIIRSSSLLEDGFGNAFAGKYESIFCVNQGSPNERYEHLLRAIQQVYASTMNEDALAYRLQRGLAESDEQMALLIQRVSGSYRKSYYFPDLAGVALSHNLYVWKEGMNSKAGILRLVLGLGTRAVDRTGEDYARLVALDQPLASPSSLDEQRTYSQHNVDLLDLENNLLKTVSFQDLARPDLIPHLSNFAIPEYDAEYTQKYWVLTFQKLLDQTDFPQVMQNMLQCIQKAYGHPVDTEFTVNFNHDGSYNINLLQCRPLQVKCNQQNCSPMTGSIADDHVLFSTEGWFLGGDTHLQISKIIYVHPSVYAELNQSDKYQIARIIGQLNRQMSNSENEPTVLLGPGRWGTSVPSLGIPVSFAEINKMTVIGEITFETAGFVPEISYGTHFFQDLVETGMIYIILNDRQEKTIFNFKSLLGLTNILDQLIPSAGKWNQVIRVIDCSNQNQRIWLHADVTGRKIACWKQD